jgi:hypothetical protein
MAGPVAGLVPVANDPVSDIWTAFTPLSGRASRRRPHPSWDRRKISGPARMREADIFVSAQPTLVVMAGLTYRFQTAAISPAPTQTLFTK